MSEIPKLLMLIMNSRHITPMSVFDPWANRKEVKEEFGISLIKNWEQKHYDAIVLAVAHNEFKNIPFSKLAQILLLYMTPKHLLKET